MPPPLTGSPEQLHLQALYLHPRVALYWVEGALSSIAGHAKDFPTHFPPDSKTGNDTEASPAIWENMDDFTARADKLAADANALLADLPSDQAAVGKAMQTLGANCGACHEIYRVKN